METANWHGKCFCLVDGGGGDVISPFVGTWIMFMTHTFDQILSGYILFAKQRHKELRQELNVDGVPIKVPVRLRFVEFPAFSAEVAHTCNE